MARLVFRFVPSVVWLVFRSVNSWVGRVIPFVFRSKISVCCSGDFSVGSSVDFSIVSVGRLGQVFDQLFGFSVGVSVHDRFFNRFFDGFYSWFFGR